MEEKKSGYREKPACAEVNQPYPEFLTCQRCGEDIEIWTDDEKTYCIFCGYHLFKKESIVH